MKKIFLLVAIPFALAGQTTINGTRVIKGTLDASGAVSTLPHRTGTGSPAGRDACSKAGETYFQTDAVSGQNAWMCTAAGTPGTWAQTSGSGVSVPSVFGRTGAVTAQSGDYNAAQVTNAADTTAANTFSQAQAFAGGASLGSKALTTTYTNDGSTGTSTNKTVKLSGSPSRAVQAATTDTAGIVGICASGCGTTLTAEVAIRGLANCVFDGGTTAGDYVQSSGTVAGNCHDAGGSYPSSGQVLGRVLGTNASGGTYAMQLSGPEIQAGVSNASAQANKPWYCNSTNGTLSYTCTLNAASALTTYTTGMWLTLTADTSSTGAAVTLNVDGVGVRNVRQSDGSTNPAAGQITAGRPVTLAYDGTAWRLPQYTGVPFTATANQFVTAIDATGVATKAQPSFANLSGSAAAAQMPALTGDVTSSAGSTATTLATVNAGPGACGDSTHVCQVTTNGKGLVTAQTAVPISGGGGGISSLNGLSSGSQAFGNDTNVTISSAGTTHTLGWSGLLGLARGGLSANLSATGGAHQVLQQTAAGSAVTVGQLAAADISGLAASATTDATNAGNISTGTLAGAQLPATAVQTNQSNTFTGGTQDLSGAAHTMPAKKGTVASIPATCTQGELYFATDATAGRQMYQCDSTNHWTQELGGGPPGGTSGQVQYNNAGSLGGFSVVGDGTLNTATGALAVTKTNGTAFAASATVDTTNANNISSGTVAAARMPQVTNSMLAGSIATSKLASLQGTDPNLLTAGTVSGTGATLCTDANGGATTAGCSGGGGGGATYTGVGYSATPTFTVGSNTVTSWAITLSGNVTSSTLSGAAAGNIFNFKVCQNATGGYTFTWPTGFSNATTIAPTAGACTKQSFFWDGGAAVPTGPATVDSGPTIFTEVAAPSGNPASGSEYLWPDSTAHMLQAKDSSGNVNSFVRTASSGTASQWVDYITPSGMPHTSQPAFSSLSGTIATAQLGGTVGGNLSGTLPNPTVAKINGTSVPTNSASDQVLSTTASATAAWTSIGSCSGTSNALTYNTATHAFGCNTISGGGGGGASYASVGYSATPTFTVGSNTVTSWAITLSGNVTSSTLSGASAGNIFNFKVCQNATGGYTFTWPTGFGNAATIAPSASACTKQSFFWDGSVAVPTGPATVDSGPTILAEGPVPTANPALGAEFLWADSTAKTVQTKDSSGNIASLVRTKGSRDVNKFVTNVDASGIQQTAAIASADLPASVRTITCQPGIGDGLNAIPAGTYLQSECLNEFGTTWTITAIKCYTDNNGSSTLNVTNGAGAGLLTGTVTCSNSWGAGTQSTTTTIGGGDYTKFTFVSDGTSKQTTWVVTGTR